MEFIDLAPFEKTWNFPSLRQSPEQFVAMVEDVGFRFRKALSDAWLRVLRFVQRKQRACDFFPFLHAQVAEFVFDFSDEFNTKLAQAPLPSYLQFFSHVNSSTFSRCRSVLVLQTARYGKIVVCVSYVNKCGFNDEYKKG